jgi:hypothetical protein
MSKGKKPAVTQEEVEAHREEGKYEDFGGVIDVNFRKEDWKEQEKKGGNSSPRDL